ncbi:MAG: membrane fusion protein (multidrug efflux system) [Limisphaerales bacterium]|jgi:membrane fusion protein (multidrug efflux system)
MKTRIIFAYLAAFVGVAMISSCSSATEEQKIEKLESKLRKQESAIRKSNGKIGAFREQIAILGGDTIQTPEIVPITTMIVSKKDFEIFVDVPATVVSKDDVMVSSDLGGLIVRLLVDEGDYVSRGQLIAELDAQIVQSNIAEVEQSLSLAQIVFEKRQRLWDQKIGSEIEYLQAKNNVESLNKTIATLNTQLSKLNLRAPISGVIDAVMIESGEMAGPGMPVVRVVNLNRVQIKADVPEIYVGKVKKGDKVNVDISALGKTIEARVSNLGQTINVNNRTFSLEVEMSNPDKILKPNLVGSIRIRENFIADQIVIPGRLVQSSFGDNFVYIVNESSKIAEKRMITVGEAANGEMVVLEGLEEGDILVDEGFRNVSDQTLISVSPISSFSAE